MLQSTELPPNGHAKMKRAQVFDQAAVEERDRTVDDRRPALRLVPGGATEALQLVGSGRESEAFGESLLIIGQDTERKRMAADDRSMRLRATADAGHHERRIDADARHGIRRHARE